MAGIIADGNWERKRLYSSWDDAIIHERTQYQTFQPERLRYEQFQNWAYLLEQSLALVTALVPEIGYDRAANLAKQDHKTGKNLRELALEDGIAAEVLDNLLDPASMTEPKS